MRRILTIVALLVLGGVVFLWWMGRTMRDPESARGLPPETDLLVEDDFPDFAVSDPNLQKPTQYTVQEQILAADGLPLPRAPYLFLLDDGRWVFGYANERGYTHPFFVGQATKYEFLTYEDAIAKYQALRNKVKSQTGPEEK